MMHTIWMIVIIVCIVLVFIDACILVRGYVNRDNPVRQAVEINWHAMVLRHTQWPDQTPPPCTLTCSCGRTWEVAK